MIEIVFKPIGLDEKICRFENPEDAAEWFLSQSLKYPAIRVSSSGWNEFWDYVEDVSGKKK